jgi:predicted DNA-binding transcriptional regulator AlpA
MEQYLSVRDAARLLGLSTSSLYRRGLPVPDVKIGPVSGWDEQTILDWDRDWRKQYEEKKQ